MVTIVFRTAIFYFLLMLAIKMMGKRQIGELEISELVSTLLISEIAAIPIDDPDIPFLNAVIPIFLILSAEILLSYFKNKCDAVKRVIEGRPSFLVYNGKLNQRNLSANRLSVNEFLTEMHGQGIGDIEDVRYAILEGNGKISFLKQDAMPFFHPLVVDGTVYPDGLTALSLDEAWLDDYLKKEKITLDRVFLLMRESGGKTRLIRKEDADPGSAKTSCSKR